MSESNLMLHAGGREVTLDELREVRTPEGTDTWFPVPHAEVVTTVGKVLNGAGFTIERARYGLARNDARMFCTMDLSTPLAQGVKLAVGVRNSCDKSFPIGFVAGSRVFVCDNLAFRSEISVARKHTRYGETRFLEATSLAVQNLQQFRDTEVKRICAFRDTGLLSVEADSLILQAYERGVISSHSLPDVVKCWRAPEFEEFQPRTVWSLFNAFTSALGGAAAKNPQRFAATTMELNTLFDTFVQAL